MAELIVIMRPQVTGRRNKTTAKTRSAESRSGTKSLNEVCRRHQLAPFARLFKKACIKRWDESPEASVHHPRQFLRTTGDRAKLKKLARELSRHEGVHLAYVAP